MDNLTRYSILNNVKENKELCKTDKDIMNLILMTNRNGVVRYNLARLAKDVVSHTIPCERSLKRLENKGLISYNQNTITINTWLR
jgi:predicted transcriptional regulator